MTEILIRPMTEGDVEAAYSIASDAFAEDREEVRRRSPEEVAHRQERYRHFLHTDPGGAWVAADGEKNVVGVVVALRREGVWVLSLFALDAAYRGRGIGGDLLRRALDYGEGCKGGIIASSTHPAAMRSYALAGFTLLPTLAAKGVVDRKSLPEKLAVREGGESDLDLAADVDRRLRGAAHGPDLSFILGSGARLLVSERSSGRGYAVVSEGSPWVVAATADEVAADLLWACLASASGPETRSEVNWLTGDQDWAVRVALEAGLSLKPEGPICVKGELGPLAPYLPSGPFL